MSSTFCCPLRAESNHKTLIHPPTKKKTLENPQILALEDSITDKPSLCLKLSLGVDKTD